MHRTDIWLVWKFNEDSEIVPSLAVEDEEVRSAVFEHFSVDNAKELEKSVGADKANVDKFRVGVVVEGEGGPTFQSQATLLESVEGVSEELAQGLANEFADIPRLCERARRSGTAFLGELKTDMEHQGEEWVEELNDLIHSVNNGDGFEQRMKDAGVWVEPQTSAWN
jgi:hypothetical protein